MRELPLSLIQTLESDSLTIAHGYILTRNDGVKLCFCDHDCEILVGENSFSPAKSIDIGHGENTQGLSIDSNLLIGGFEIGDIEENDIKIGKWENAKVEIILFDWQNPSSFITIFYGFINAISQSDVGFEFELSGQRQQLKNQIGRSVSRNCDAILGDEKCGINLVSAGHFYDAEILGNSGIDFIEANALLTNNDEYIFGKVAFKSGQLTGFEIGIKDIVKKTASTLIFLDAPLPIAPNIGDLITVFKGCDKSFATCKSRFQNGENFRGCPHLPGQTDIFSGPTVSGNDGGKRV